MYSYGPPHIAEQRQDDQLKPTYSSYVRIQDLALRTYQKQWTIGRSGERGSEISVLVMICISKSQRSSYTSFSRMDSRLCIYHLFVSSNLNFLHNSLWITFPTQSYTLIAQICCICLYTIPIYRYVWNGHIMFIYIYTSEHRDLETRKTLTTSQFRYETFYYFWV